MKQGLKIQKWLFSIRRYLCFFLLMAFVITCCMTLFLNTLSETMGIQLSEGNLNTAARLTFANVIFLSILCTFIDGIRRKYMVDRPVAKIVDAAEKIMQGDLSVRIDAGRGGRNNEFNVIIDYFNKMAAELSGVETLRTDFIANVSHELKTPLAAMQNYGTLLQCPQLAEDKRIEYAKAITYTSRRLAELISNILKLNKLENQQVYPNIRVFDLGEQLCECLLTFETVWEKKNIDIQTDIEEEVFVKSDAELLTLVWNNLFSNALKFTDEGGCISVGMKSEGKSAIVTITDTGCGIAPEVGKHIFEKFYQGDPSHATQGNGLGLALVKRVIDIVGGDISVDSELGKGSSFTVRIGRMSHEENIKRT